MPRYHFHTEDGECLRDEDGVELADLEAAKREAVKLLGESLSDDACQFWVHEAFRVIVTDADGLTLLTLDVGVTLSPALASLRGPRDGAAVGA